MKVRKSVIKILNSNVGHGLIMVTLGVSPSTARKLVSENPVDSDLTKASMVKAIAEKFQFPEDKILFDEKIEKDNVDSKSAFVG